MRRRSLTLILASAMCLAVGLAVRALTARTTTAPAVAGDEPVAIGLVKISLGGTSVDITPHYIDIITDAPKAEAGKAAKFWGVPCGADGVTLTHGRIVYRFSLAGKWRCLGGLKLNTGDVIYTFLSESTGEKRRLLDRTKLRKSAGQVQLDEGNTCQVIAGDEHFYIIILEKAVSFECEMHSEVKLPLPGRCPKCGLELVEMEYYR